MYVYKNLVDIPMAKIVEAFNLAFADYAFDITLSEESAAYLFKTNAVKLELSFGAFYEGELIGFIINSYGIYNGEKSVFDFATAIVPEHRDKGVFSNLFNYVEKSLVSRDVKCYYLQVLQGNNAAIRKYKNKGFDIIREFSVLRYSSEEQLDYKSNALYINEIEYSAFDFEKAKNCEVLPFAFEYNKGILDSLKGEYKIFYKRDNKAISAFCICSKKGEIAQIGYAKIDDLEQVIKYITSKYKKISARNIDMRFEQVIEILKKIGFEEQTKQYEMLKKLV